MTFCLHSVYHSHSLLSLLTVKIFVSRLLLPFFFYDCKSLNRLLYFFFFYYQFSCSVMSNASCNLMDCSMPAFPVHHQLPELTQTYIHWVGDAIQPSHPSVIPFSSCPQSFPASGSFQINQLVTSGGQRIGVSASTLVLPMNTQGWSPLGRTSWISLQSKGLSRVFSNTTVQKHQFFGAQLSSQSNSHIHTWPQEKP